MENPLYRKGIGVCILDTGIYEHIDFTGRIWAFYDFLAFKRRPYDDNGHGTHVAGLVGQEMALLPWENTEAQHQAAESLP